MAWVGTRLSLEQAGGGAACNNRGWGGLRTPKLPRASLVPTGAPQRRMPSPINPLPPRARLPHHPLKPPQGTFHVAGRMLVVREPMDPLLQAVPTSRCLGISSSIPPRASPLSPRRATRSPSPFAHPPLAPGRMGNLRNAQILLISPTSRWSRFKTTCGGFP